jgi:hypothetical protein
MAKGKPLIGSMKLDPLYLQPLRHAISQRQTTQNSLPQ